MCTYGKAGAGTSCQHAPGRDTRGSGHLVCGHHERHLTGVINTRCSSPCRAWTRLLSVAPGEFTRHAPSLPRLALRLPTLTACERDSCHTHRRAARPRVRRRQGRLPVARLRTVRTVRTHHRPPELAHPVRPAAPVRPAHPVRPAAPVRPVRGPRPPRPARTHHSRWRTPPRTGARRPVTLACSRARRRRPRRARRGLPG